MQFRTELKISPFSRKFNYKSSFFLLGSCFSENIGARLRKLKFSTVVNPFGILYNPISIADALEQLIQNKLPKDHYFIQHNERWHSFAHHSSLSQNSIIELKSTIKDILHEERERLLKSDVLTITLGSAWYYHHLDRNIDVANCHKVPARAFEKRLCNVTNVQQKLEKVLGEIRKLNPNITFLFTVSPVRHLKDGMIENQRSKGILLELSHRLVEQLENAFYFPAYELMMDDLRDYRFYEDDMLHPNQVAVDYIWKKFMEVAFEEVTLRDIEKLKQLISAINHRPFNPKSKGHQQFVQKHIERAHSYETALGIDLKAEINQLTQQLISENHE